MGLLVLGTPLPWDDSKKYATHVREHGITQLLNLWDRVKNKQGDQLLWGDEVCIAPRRFPSRPPERLY